MFFFNQLVFRNTCHENYEQIAKPGNQYSVYSNQHYQGEVILKRYLVVEIFQDKASGFYALGLVSKSRKTHPALVIRGCGNWGDFKDFPREFLPYKDIPDVIINGSNEHYQASKKLGVLTWLEKQASLGKKPDLVGQSLGGKVAQQLAIEVPECIHSLVTFNSIGISEAEWKKYKSNIKIFHYVNPLDLVPYIFGEKFLPGTILQTYNPNIAKPDLLSHHNKVILNDSKTEIKKIKIETFDLNRDVYQVVKEYSKTIQKALEELKQSAKQKEIINKEAPNLLNSLIGKNFERSYQIIQQEFSQMAQSVREELLNNTKKANSKQLHKQPVINSVEVIQKEIDSLSNIVYHKLKNREEFSKSFQQRLQNLSVEMQNKLDKFFKEP
ncbi:MAG: hypothetical protein WBG73_18460 [Coleofasciculaceae cyanobacterium]